MNERLSLLALMLVRVLGIKMIGLLHIGSNERHDETAFSDVDLILLVENFHIQDFRAVREIIRNLDYLVDMPVIQGDQLLANPDLFQMGTHGCYFLHVLKSARTIHGANFFKDYPEPSITAVRTSVFRKVAEYAWAVRRAFVESNRERSTYQNYQITSRLLKTVKDVLWLSGSHTSHSLTAMESISSLEDIAFNLLSLEEWKIMKMISTPDFRNSLVANMSEDFLQVRVSVFEKLYAHAVFLLEGRQ